MACGRCQEGDRAPRHGETCSQQCLFSCPRVLLPASRSSLGSGDLPLVVAHSELLEKGGKWNLEKGPELERKRGKPQSRDAWFTYFGAEKQGVSQKNILPMYSLLQGKDGWRVLGTRWLQNRTSLACKNTHYSKNPTPTSQQQADMIWTLNRRLSDPFYPRTPGCKHRNRQRCPDLAPSPCTKY
jgi:hypothetical protein